MLYAFRGNRHTRNMLNPGGFLFAVTDRSHPFFVKVEQLNAGITDRALRNI